MENLSEVKTSSQPSQSDHEVDSPLSRAHAKAQEILRKIVKCPTCGRRYIVDDEIPDSSDHSHKPVSVHTHDQ